MKSNMILEVEFLAGTDIKDAISEAKVKCEKLDLAFIKFNFNGVKVSVLRDTDVLELRDKVIEVMKDSKSLKIAIG